jgi:hypothetical protein
MSEYIHLIGADDVRSAGHQMACAASEMSQAASSFDSVFERQRRFMDDWLQRFESVLEEMKK